MPIKMQMRLPGSLFQVEYGYFLLSLLSMVALGAMKTLIGRELWYTFFIIVPGLYYLPLLKKKKSKFHKQPLSSEHKSQ